MCFKLNSRMREADDHDVRELGDVAGMRLTAKGSEALRECS